MHPLWQAEQEAMSAEDEAARKAKDNAVTSANASLVEAQEKQTAVRACACACACACADADAHACMRACASRACFVFNLGPQGALWGLENLTPVPVCACV